MRPIEQVGPRGEDPVGDAVLQGHSPGIAEEARTVDDGRLTFEDGLQDARIVVRFVFQVAILYQDDVASGTSDAGANGRAFTRVRDAVVRDVRQGLGGS